MNIQEATKLLAKLGIKITKIAANKFRINYFGGEVFEPFRSKGSKLPRDGWTGAEVIEWARNPHRIAKGDLKHFDNAKNRRQTRDLIGREEFDSIPQNKKAKGESRWNWD